MRDAVLLVAFAAQSCRSIKPEKVEALAEAVAKIAAARAAGITASPPDCAAFWIAYDELAVDMAPLSAQSIRSSININARRFPASLLTPTAYNAVLAVLVFFLCLALQGFWVAGKELVERADSLETQKVDLQQKMTRNSGALKRAIAREESIRCSLIPCDDIPTVQAAVRNKADKVAPSRIAALEAERQLAHAEVSDKELIAQDLNEELAKLNDRSRPLESLLRKWHDRARVVCNNDYLKFLCPVDNPKEGSDDSVKLKSSILETRNKLDGLKEEYEKTRQGSLGQQISSRLSIITKQRELNKLEQELARLDADRFHSIVVEVRIIVANIGAYLIAMVMGLLGALTYILRALSHQLREHTYVPISVSASIVRICLGAIAGVFGSQLVPGTNASLMSLPPLFIPFVFGYGIEILFSLLDKVVRSFTQAEPVNSRLSSRA